MAELRHYPMNPEAWANDSAFVQQDAKSLRRTAEAMIDFGLRYQKLERDLKGPGSLLVLGTDLAEDMWYKRLPKKDEYPRRRVLDWLQSEEVQLPQKAAPYARLYRHIIDSKLMELRQIASNIRANTA
ncbi:hypothetical protein AC578_10104 [Pseudocercospora eumusae]|uniref:Uncharacterized protein n=1 Tax=Pseudocercospora eumusae TaxID=321146 RepID=A0A139GVM8_9PEZI|nr:hypothetical protein AC578_10104 [Pseudocercospora eumusae]